MPTGQQVNPLLNLLPLVFIFIVFYFLLIRPQKSKEKEQHKMLDALEKNDEIVTVSGIHGTIVNVKDKTITLRVDDNVKIEMEKSCVAYVKKNQVAK
ncbi:MAG: preprotein translocase subunit YajC [Candidatus Omnitrophota bacterium]|nr:preprotein translocase subunit YajC [Candidatus Omnitrophota bacterium]MBU1929197.1 preprotein translocase subunit YajC [Candidatus Omnitrophota bacterium]MBU2035488.1 preprotein translocase subunit YajC [Candidatus Omnitrophota bacterium]MBU2221604.1 preprotein translocase subunit YajC [Candidatus Omnitrophota bacterium]MBU2257840.1 preprotein translocase subunit YajC [Candidatus Omnitrophota bacterium]